jgi:hypothetical protein
MLHICGTGTTRMKPVYLLLLWLAPADLLAAELTPLHKLDRAALEERLAADARDVALHRQGLRDVSNYMATRPDLFPVKRADVPPLMRREQKEAVWRVWQRFLDYMLALGSVEGYHAQYYRLKGASREDSFLIGYAAMLARYRAALEFIDRADYSPGLDKILNDPVPEIGLPEGTYAKLKFKYLNVAMATDFTAHEVLLKTFSGQQQPALREAIRVDAEYLWNAGKGRGEVLTLKNALKVVQSGAETAWFPVQAGVAEWMGHTKVYRAGQSLISRQQVQQLEPRLLPGDVLLERREWFLSNIGLPGFWSHAALYIGTPEQRRAFFAEPDTRTWVKAQGEQSGDLEALLQTRSEAACRQSQTPREEGHPVRVIEAIGEGVSFTSLEHSAACDSLAVLRPRLPRAERAQAIARAFHYAGRPYDYNFDFATDSELVCTELVYKSYEPAGGFKGLLFPLVEMLGRKVTPANELAKQFDEQSTTGEQQFDLVFFLDGQERHKTAIESSVTEFRQTWKRPKWHVLVQQ